MLHISLIKPYTKVFHRNLWLDSPTPLIVRASFFYEGKTAFFNGNILTNFNRIAVLCNADSVFQSFIRLSTNLRNKTPESEPTHRCCPSRCFSPSCGLAAAVSALPPLLSSADPCTFWVIAAVVSRFPVHYRCRRLPQHLHRYSQPADRFHRRLPRLQYYSRCRMQHRPSAPSCAASAVTGSMVSIINPARVPARKRLFLFSCKNLLCVHTDAKEA